jgi:histidyl-tRNA synthetase
VERILLAGSEQPIAPDPVDLLVAPAGRGSAGASAASFELAREARRTGLAAQLELGGRSLKGALRHADRIDARYVAIVDETGERANLREMGSGDQHELAIAAVIPTILRGSRL